MVYLTCCLPRPVSPFLLCSLLFPSSYPLSFFLSLQSLIKPRPVSHLYYIAKNNPDLMILLSLPPVLGSQTGDPTPG